MPDGIDEERLADALRPDDRGGLDAASLAVLDLRNATSTILLRGGSHAQYAPTGHLVYAAVGTLRAVGFDLTHLKIVGTSTPVVPQVLTTSIGIVDAGLARDGTLIYVVGAGGSGAGRTLVWVDRQGHETPIEAKPRAYFFPRVSPDGARVAVTVLDEKTDIWLLGLDRPTLTRVTSDSANHSNAVWTRDGHRMVFSLNRGGTPNLFSQAADGTGPVERLTESPNAQAATAVSPDGIVVFTQRSSTTGYDVMAVALDGQHQVTPLVQTPFDERNGIVSPDGRWLAYEGERVGVVRDLCQTLSRRGVGARRSRRAAAHSRCGRAMGGSCSISRRTAVMRVAVADGAAWSVGAPTKVLDGRYVVRGVAFSREYDIARDGQRFLMMKGAGNDATSALPQIVVVQHFDEELKRLVPMK